MESVSKDDDLALSMSDCFTGEEALLGLFLWFLPTANKKLQGVLDRAMQPGKQVTERECWAAPK